MTSTSQPQPLHSSQTFAVLTRGMYDETPFIDEFVRYYFDIGFDHVYFINSDSRRDYLAQCLTADVLARVTVVDSANLGEDWQEHALNEALQAISETWILVVDLDEFLFLHGQTIQQYVSRCPPDCSKLRFRWLLSLSTRYFESSVFDMVDGRLSSSITCKAMTKRQSVRTLSLHDALTIDGDSMECTTDYVVDPFVLHFACRGFLDLISRIVGRNYGNDKAGPAEEQRLRHFLCDPHADVDQFPFRFQMYRVQMTSPLVQLRLDRADFYTTCGIDLERTVLVAKAKLDALGWPIEATTLNEVERAIEAKSHLRVRLFCNLPDQRFIRMHVDDGLSYINATRAYVRSLAGKSGSATLDAKTGGRK